MKHGNSRLGHRPGNLAGIALVIALALSACAPNPSREAFERGKRLLAEGQPEQALEELAQAVRANPGNPEFQATYFRQRDSAIVNYLTAAEDMRRAEKFDAAEAAYARVFRIDQNNQRARAGVVAVQVERRWKEQMGLADALFAKGDYAGAEARLHGILVESPAHPAARALSTRIAQRQAETAVPSAARAALAKPITLEFREATLRSVFDVISRTSGINFVFDKDVRADTKVTVFLRNTPIDDAIKLVLATNQLERKQLNENSYIIFPNTAAKLREYQQLVVRSFYLSNVDVKQTLNMIKTVVKTRDVFIDEKLNMLVMRDTPEAVRMAEKLIAAQDLAEPEVVLEVEVLEIKRSRLTDLGIQWPNQVTVLNIVPAPTTTTAAAGVVVQANNSTTTTTQLTWANLLGGPKANQLGINNPQINLRDDNGDTNLLANPRIRVKNREKAKIHIGDRVPVITTTSTANVGVSESVNYLDIGLKLDVEPIIYLEDEVSIRVGLEVSNIVREIKSTAGTLTYQVGTRNASTSLRLRNGETQALAGLISDEDRTSTSRVPGLGDLPIVGRLFSNQRDEKVKTEIVLLITPRIVRNLPRLQVAAAEFNGGTDAAAGAAALTIRPTPPGAVALRSSGGVPAVPVARTAAGAPAAGPPPVQSAPEPVAVAETSALAGEPVAIALSAKGELAAGEEFVLTIALPPGAQSGELTLAFNPAALVPAVQSPGAAAGRLQLNIEAGSAGGSLEPRFRVIAKGPDNAQIAVEAAVLQSADGQAMNVTRPPPLQLRVLP
ncbi:MAG: secretin and TonB N-terminal domain-containing protein [Betaproteobacteria bacterium]